MDAGLRIRGLNSDNHWLNDIALSGSFLSRPNPVETTCFGNPKHYFRPKTHLH